MKLSDNGLEILKSLETFSAEPYNDEAGNATIGYGTLMHYGPVTDAEKNIRWTVRMAIQRLQEDVAKYEQSILHYVNVPLNQNQFDALVLWEYNCGLGSIANSTWLKDINKGNYAAVPEAMKLWNKVEKQGVLVVSPGLVSRREQEAQLFQEAVA